MLPASARTCHCSLTTSPIDTIRLPHDNQVISDPSSHPSRLLLTVSHINWPTICACYFSGFSLYDLVVAHRFFFIAAFSERTPIFEKLWVPISYIYLAASGFPYMASWLPGWLRPIMLAVMPSLPCYEMIRGGIFGPKVHVYYNCTRLSFTLAGITLFGLLGLRDVRRYMVGEG